MPLARRLVPHDDPVLDEAWRSAWSRDVDATVDLVAGDERRAILAVAEEIDADVIVVGGGARRLRGLGRRLLACTARTVLVVDPRSSR